MELRDKINYWVDNSDYDLQTAEAMHSSGRYAYTAFMCQQALEKIIKAVYLQENSQEAPRSHSLVYLVGLLKSPASENHLSLLSELSSYYIEGRYPTYKEKIASLVNCERSKHFLAKTREVFQWLKSRII
jgi:HEPN domain-containing protein